MALLPRTATCCGSSHASSGGGLWEPHSRVTVKFRGPGKNTSSEGDTGTVATRTSHTVAPCPSPFHRKRTADTFRAKDVPGYLQNPGHLSVCHYLVHIASKKGRWASCNVGRIRGYTPPRRFRNAAWRDPARGQDLGLQAKRRIFAHCATRFALLTGGVLLCCCGVGKRLKHPSWSLGSSPKNQACPGPLHGDPFKGNLSRWGTL